MKRLYLLAFGLLLSLAPQARAVNHYYVSSTGSGTACNQLAPCATITQASKTLTLGTGGTVSTTGTYTSFANIAAVVHVAPGTYNECVVTQQSTGYTTHNGAPTQKILFVSDTQFGAQVRCNNGSNGVIWQNGTGGSANGQYVIQYGFDIAGDSCWGIRNDAAFGEHYGNKVHDVTHGGGSLCSNGGAGISDNQTGNASPNNSHDSITEGNLIDNIGTATTGSCPNVHGVYIASERDIVRNNIISRSCGWGIQYFHFTSIGVCTNNVIINNRNGGIVVTASDGGESANNYTCSNNIVAHNGGNEFGIEERYGNASGASSIYRNNLYWGNAPTSGCSNGISNCPYNMSYGSRDNSGSTNTGSDSSVFVNYTGNALTGDYHLKVNITGSVAVASGGMASPIPTRDLSGATRNANPSIGVYEFAAVSSTPTIQLSTNAIPFGTVIIGQTSSPATVTVTNIGTGPLTMGSPEATLTGNTADFPFGQVGTCVDGAVLAASGGNCTISWVFNPQNIGSRQAIVTVNSNASNGQQTVTLTGTGQAPAAPHFTPPAPPIAFGSQNVFTNSLPQNYTITSDGNAPLSVTGLAVSNTLAVPNIDNFPATDLTTGCNPSSTQHWCGIHDAGTPGTATGSTAVSGTARQFNASGTAFGGFRFSVYLGNTNLNATSTVYVSDAFYTFTSSLAHVTNIEIDHNQSIGDTVIAGWQCNMTVGLWQYTTQDASQVQPASKWNNSNATCTRAQWTLNVAHHVILTSHRNATGVVTYDSVSFDGAVQNLVGATGPSNFTLGWPVGQQVENFQLDGDNTAWSTSVLLDGFNFTGYQDFYPQSNGTCGAVPFSVAIGTFCNIPMIMNPSATGSVAGSVVLTSNNSAGSPTTTALTGTATQPNATLTSPVSLGNVLLGTPSGSQPAVLANTGTGPLTVNAPTITAPFTQTNSCGTFPITIAPGGSCTFNVVCTPNVVGNINGQLTVTDDAPTPTQISALSCTGTAPATNGVKFSGGVTMSGGVRLLQPGGP